MAELDKQIKGLTELPTLKAGYLVPVQKDVDVEAESFDLLKLRNSLVWDSAKPYSLFYAENEISEIQTPINILLSGNGYIIDEGSYINCDLITFIGFDLSQVQMVGNITLDSFFNLKNVRLSDSVAANITVGLKENKVIWEFSEVVFNYSGNPLNISSIQVIGTIIIIGSLVQLSSGVSITTSTISFSLFNQSHVIINKLSLVSDISSFLYIKYDLSTTLDIMNDLYFGWWLGVYEEVLIDSLPNEKTYLQIKALIDSSGLIVGDNYKITDRGDDRGILLTAISNNKLSIRGNRLMLCPTDYNIFTDYHGNNWNGVFSSGATIAINGLAIWGGSVWRHLTESIGWSEDEETLNSDDWQKIEKASFNNFEYTECVFAIDYDFDNDVIMWQADSLGNEVINSSDNTFNPCDLTDWRWWTYKIFKNNKTQGIFNNLNADIFNNIVFGAISLNNGAVISNNIINGRIYSNGAGIVSNKCKDIILNICGSIEGNNILGTIDNNSCYNNIVNNTNKGISNNDGVNKIENNANNGTIKYCRGNYSIINNMNNGNISGILTADVTDPIVNKLLTNNIQ